MKVLVLNGSPKKEKSDTLHVTRAFLEGMNEDTQNEIRWMHVAEKNVKYCLGCFSCMRNGGRCVQTDDMKEILEEILHKITLPLILAECYLIIARKRRKHNSLSIMAGI